MSFVFNPDSASAELALCCASFIQGKPASEQPLSVRRKLTAMETAALVHYSERGSWRLTQKGKDQREAVLAYGRRVVAERSRR